MWLFKKGTPFYSDDQTQWSFEALKKDLTIAHLLSPLDYNKYFILYLESSSLTIDMVLVQEYNSQQEYVLYYLSISLSNTMLSYAHVEKLALKTIHVIQWIPYYLMLKKVLVITNIHPFQYILICLLIGGWFSKWIVIL